MKILRGLKSFFGESLPRFSIKYPWIIISIFLLIIAFFGSQLPGIYIDTDINKLTTGGEAETKAIETAARDFSIRDPLYIILLGDMDDPAVWQEASAMVAKMESVPDVLQISSPLDASYVLYTGFNILTLPVVTSLPTTEEELQQLRQRLNLSPNGKSMVSWDNAGMLLEVYLRSSYSSRGRQAIDSLERLLQKEWGEKNFHITGTSYLAQASDQNIKNDVVTLFPFAALLVAVVLFYSFHNWLGIAIPGATVLLSLVVSLGWMAWWNYPLTIVSVVLPIMLIVIGSADGIHILNKYCEESAQGLEKKEAILVTMNNLVPPCIMTSLTTAVGFLSLRTSSVIPVKDFGLFAAIGVLSALVFALVGIPALLTILPQPRVRRTRGKSFLSRFNFLEHTSNWVVDHTGLVVLIGIGILIVSGIGIGRLTIEANMARYFRNSSSVAEGIRVYEEKFGGSSQVLVVVDTNKPKGALEPEFLQLMASMEEFINSFPLVSGTVSVASITDQFNPTGGQLPADIISQVFNQLPSDYTSVFLSRDQQQKAIIYTSIISAKTTKVADTLRKMEAGLKTLSPDGILVTITGLPKIIQHHMQRFSESQIRSLFWSIIAVFILLVTFHVSFVLGLLAMIPLFFTLATNFGIMGWFSIPLDAGTVLIGSIAMGIGIDYSIHFISRVIREQKAGLDLKSACQASITTAGHAIMINAFTLIAGFLILCFSNFATLAIFGFLMALAMLISSVVSVTVLPAILQFYKRLQGGHLNVYAKKT